MNGKNSELEKIGLSEEEFNYLCALLREKAGIFIDSGKISLLQTRLLKRLTVTKSLVFRDYIKVLKSDVSGTEISEFVNAMTTNKTDFFREIEHFNFINRDFIKKLYLDNVASGQLMVWSAACSSGEEPYSIAIHLNELLENEQVFAGFDFRILGTDINSQMIKKCNLGVFEQSRFEETPKIYVQKYFEKGKGANEGYYRANSKLKEKIKFRELNLLKPNFLIPIKFDIIFLRNVLIYFEPDVILSVNQNIKSHLKHGGYLFIGHSDTLNNIDHGLELVEASIFRRK